MPPLSIAFVLMLTKYLNKLYFHALGNIKHAQLQLATSRQPNLHNLTYKIITLNNTNLYKKPLKKVLKSATSNTRDHDNNFPSMFGAIYLRRQGSCGKRQN